jgi:hypothetical protein
MAGIARVLENAIAKVKILIDHVVQQYPTPREKPRETK